jgi:chromodomain-helicase-DNA-binding protein 1
MYATYRRKQEPEEYEQHMVARETERQSQLDFQVVERVIDSQDGEDETEYFVKCKCPSFPPSSVEHI